jgi:hypothetical protein
MSDEMLELPDLSINTIFCDEIRQEATGKTIIIGVYHSDLIVHEFPTKIRHLVVRTVIVRPATTPPLGNIEFIYELPDGEVQTSEALEANPQSGPIKPDTPHAIRRVVHTKALTDVNVLESGKIRVRVKMGGKLYAAGALRISSMLSNFDESIDDAIDQNGLEAALFYSANYLPSVSQVDRARSNEAMLEILASTFGRKVHLEPIDDTSPIWIVADRMSLWVLKTHPWHNAECISVHAGEKPLKFSIDQESPISLKLIFSEPVIPLLGTLTVECSADQQADKQTRAR